MMYRRWFVLFVLAALSGLFGVNVASGSGLLDIYQQAQQNDPVLQGAHFQRLALEERHKQARARMFPSLTGSAVYTHTEQDIKSSDNVVFGAGRTDFGTTSYSLKLTQPVFHWDLIVGLRQSRNISIRAAVEYLLAQQELIVRVADLYLRALAAQDQLDFSLTEHIAAEKHLELARGRHQVGLTTITDLHDVKARMSVTLARTIDARNKRDDAWQAIEEITNQPVEQLLPLQAEIPLLSHELSDIDSWAEQGQQQNPAIELQRQTVEIARQEVQRQKAGHYPTLDLVGRYSREETGGTLFGGGSEVDTTEIMLQLNIPLYRGGLVRSQVRQANHQLNIARQDLIRQQRAIERQIRFAYLGIGSALGRIDALEQSVIASRLSLASRQEGFLSGLYTSLSVLDAERDLYLVRVDYSQARYDYILNSLQLKKAAGILNEQDIVAIDQWFN